MDHLIRPTIHIRCQNYVHRTRILGIRNVRTRPSIRNIPRSTPTVIDSDSNVEASSKTETKTRTLSSEKSSASALNAAPPKVIKPTISPTPPTPPTPTLLTLQPQTLHSYTTTRAPTAPQLQYSTSFFRSVPEHLWTGAYFRQFPSSFHPEVCFLGRSNVGKSSLLNALFNRPRARTAHVSKKPGRTRTMNAFGVGPDMLDIAKDTDKWKMLGRGGVVVVDMPGYGKGSRGEWGSEIMKYLEKRKQLRKTFLLIDVEHGLKSTDLSLVRHLRKEGIQHQIILSKVDKILYPDPKPPSPQKLSNKLLKLRSIIEEIKEEIQQPNADILCVSAEKDLTVEGMPRAGRLGVDGVRWAVLRACGLDCDEKGQKREMETFAAPAELYNEPEPESTPTTEQPQPLSRTSRPSEKWETYAPTF